MASVAGTFLAVAAFAQGSGGCAVDTNDVHRWETTERGPEKLVAVMTHDKYSLPLRTEAALSLIRMRPRAGRRIGIELMINAMSSLPDGARKSIVDAMTPELTRQIQAVRPPKNPDGTQPPDPSIPYKDAAFAMLSHEPPLVADDNGSKAALVAALTQWTQTDFESRIENGSQQYGIEQMMRYLGAPAVRGLPAMLSEESTKTDRIVGLIADSKDEETKARASEALVAMAKRIESRAWFDKQLPLVEEANKRSNQKVTPEGLRGQVTRFRDQEMIRVFASMRRIGGRPSSDYCVAYAGDKSKPDELRKGALAALEGRIDRNNASDIDRIFQIAKDDTTPDGVRDLAFARLGELPKDQIVPKLYTLFDGSKWKVRWVAASVVLKTLTTKGLPEFMRRLPASSNVKMGMTEAFTYGEIIQRMDAPPGDPKPREAIVPFLTSGNIGAKLTALGFFFHGKKSDMGLIKPHEDERTPVPRCDAADECGWTCEVPKAPGSQETESKTIATIGDFVKFCIEPSLEGG